MGEHYVPRRAEKKKPKWGRIEAGATAVALLGAGIGWAALRGGGDVESGSASTPKTSGATTCPSSATLAVDPDYQQLVSELAESYGTSLGADCLPIEVDAQASAQVAAAGLQTADAWLPEDSSWQHRAAGEAAALAGAPATVIAQTPLVLAYPRDVRTAMGDERQSGANLVAMLTEEKKYDADGQPWGTIKLVEPDPNTSAVGAIGFMTLATMLSNGEPPPTDPATATANQLRMVAAEHRVVERVATSAEVLGKLATNPADDTVRGPAGPRTGLTTEYALLTAADSRADLAADYLGDGGVGVQLAIVDPGENPTVQGFVDWLTSAEGREQLAEAGLRAGDQTPASSDLTQVGLPTEPLPAQRPNSAEEVIGATMVQAAFAQRSSVLTVLDLSGSMGAQFGNTGLRRVDVVTQAALSSWASWPLGYSSGLITFNADAAGNPVIAPVFGLQDNRSPEWKAQMPLFQASLANLQPQGGTPLYLAIWESYHYNLNHYQAGKANKIIILTDGVDEAHNATITLHDLMTQLPTAVDPARPIELIYILIGPDADYPTVSQIAAATGSTAIWVRDINELPIVMQGLLAA